MRRTAALTILVAAVGALLCAIFLARTGGTAPTDAVLLPCLLDFSMEGCAPCQQARPIVEAAKKQYAGRLRVEIVEISRFPDLQKRLSITETPTLVLFDSAGREVGRHRGAPTQEEMVALLGRINLAAGDVKTAEPGQSLESLFAMLECSEPPASAQDTPKPPAPAADGYAVYYLHSTLRSGCSYSLEETARDTITAQLKPRLNGNEFAWTTLCIEEPANEGWAKTFELKLADYDMTRGIAVLAEMSGGKPRRWKVIGDLVSYRTDLDALAAYVRENTAEFLAQKAPAPAAK